MSGTWTFRLSLCMKLKLDENLGRAAARLLAEAGLDVASVPSQNLQGAEDPSLISICQRKGRCLVTLDLDFSNTLLFPPGQYSGIAVLRPRAKPSHQDLLECVGTLARALKKEDIVGRLWIVEAHRVRVHREPNIE